MDSFLINEHPQQVHTQRRKDILKRHPMVAWSKLPQLYRMAPEFYQPLLAYRSYTRLIFKFICDKNISPLNRWVRPDAPQQKGSAS
jgi:Sphingolipid Delta4-desaturase (DES)